MPIWLASRPLGIAQSVIHDKGQSDLQGHLETCLKTLWRTIQFSVLFSLFPWMLNMVMEISQKSSSTLRSRAIARPLLLSPHWPFWPFWPSCPEREKVSLGVTAEWRIHGSGMQSRGKTERLPCLHHKKGHGIFGLEGLPLLEQVGQRCTLY